MWKHYCVEDYLMPHSENIFIYIETFHQYQMNALPKNFGLFIVEENLGSECIIAKMYMTSNIAQIYMRRVQEENNQTLKTRHRIDGRAQRGKSMAADPEEMAAMTVDPVRQHLPAEVQQLRPCHAIVVVVVPIRGFLGQLEVA